MNWLKQTLNFGEKIKKLFKRRPSKSDIENSDWISCCKGPMSKADLEKNLFVCASCNKHFHITPIQRFDMMFGKGNYEILKTPLYKEDVLDWVDKKSYKERLKQAKKKTNQDCAVLVAKGKLKGIDVTIGAVNFEFIGGAHGQNESEAIIFAAEHATKNQTPLILMPCGGGQVMFQGARALVGMTRTTLAVSEFKKNTNLPYIVVFHYKCAGGITASYAHLSEIAIAENENSEIIFAGRRVIEGTIKEELPSNFQKASWALEKGFIDNIIDRKDLPEKLGSLLSILLNKKSQVSSENNEQTSESNITTREAS